MSEHFDAKLYSIKLAILINELQSLQEELKFDSDIDKEKILKKISVLEVQIQEIKKLLEYNGNRLSDEKFETLLNTIK